MDQMPGPAEREPRPGGGPAERAQARPLLLTDDPVLLDDLLRLSAAAGVEVEVAAEAGRARVAWSRAPLVLVGADVAAACAEVGLPRRQRVVLVGADLDDAGVWQRAVRLGAEHVVFLPDAEPWLITALTDALEPDARPGRLLAVVGGRGGAGATTLAVALAFAGARSGYRTTLIDVDPLGGGIDLALGIESSAGLRWPELAGVRGRVPAAGLAPLLPRYGDLTVLSWDRSDQLFLPPDAVTAVVDAALRANELVVADLPRLPDAAVDVVLARAGVTLLVVPAELRAVSSAARVATALSMRAGDIRVVVRGPAPGRLSAPAVAASLGMQLAGSIRAEPGLAAAYERGEPPGMSRRGPLGAFCDRFLAELVRTAEGTFPDSGPAVA